MFLENRNLRNTTMVRSICREQERIEDIRITIRKMEKLGVIRNA